MNYPPATKSAALTIPCPYCHAPEGTTCQGKRGDRTALHLDRYQAAAATTTRETRHYDLGPIGKPDCTCEGIGYVPIDGIDGVTRWHPCPCRERHP